MYFLSESRSRMIALSRNLLHHCRCKRKIVRALLAPQNRRLSILRPLPVIDCFEVKAAAKMASGGGDDKGRTYDPASNPKVVKLRETVNDDAADGWEKCWEEELTPWDLGQTTPVVFQLVQSGSLPTGRVLVPGCGSGYDVVAMAGHERYVVGLDISTTAIEKAKELSSSLPNANQFTFVLADFFTWQPTEKFDLIFDYTFFCAIDPCLRPAWAERVQELLKPDGELITLIYLISDQEAGPPYNTTVSDYEEVLNPLGFKAILVEDNELAVKPRKTPFQCIKDVRFEEISGR